MSILARAATNVREVRGADPLLPWGDSTPPTLASLGSPAAGTTVTEKSALQVAAVYGSVSLLADAVATLPLKQYRGKGSNKKEIDPSPVVEDPYAEITQQDWLTQTMFSEELRGNFYGRVIDRDKNLYPTQIKPIHPDDARVTRARSGPTKGQPEYRFEGELVSIDDVFHIRSNSVAGSLVGLNPIEVCRNSIGLARAADLAAGTWFSNSSMPAGALEVEGALNEEETLQLARQWMMVHQGIGQMNMPAVLTEGTKFNPIAVNPKDMQFLESRQFTAAEISGLIYRVPPHMLGIVDRTTSWGMGIQQQELGFVRNTLLAKVKRIEVAFNRILPKGQHVKFDLRHRLEGDTLQRLQGYMLERTMALRTINEQRVAEGWPPLDVVLYPWADDPMAPLNSAQNGSLAVHIGGSGDGQQAPVGANNP